LEIITPKEMDFKIINSTSPNIVQGQEIWVTGKLFAKRRMRWHSRITSFKPYEYIDEMISGPFKKWKHLHKFVNNDAKQKTIATIMTEVKDEIEFELPYGILGRVFENYAYRQLQNTFEYREIATIKALANN
jgi:ligand-binding SRPBCC domain-containing protein